MEPESTLLQSEVSDDMVFSGLPARFTFPRAPNVDPMSRAHAAAGALGQLEAAECATDEPRPSSGWSVNAILGQSSSIKEWKMRPHIAATFFVNLISWDCVVAITDRRLPRRIIIRNLRFQNPLALRIGRAGRIDPNGRTGKQFFSSPLFSFALSPGCARFFCIPPSLGTPSGSWRSANAALIPPPLFVFLLFGEPTMCCPYAWGRLNNGGLGALRNAELFRNAFSLSFLWSPYWRTCSFCASSFRLGPPLWVLAFASLSSALPLSLWAHPLAQENRKRYVQLLGDAIVMLVLAPQGMLSFFISIRFPLPAFFPRAHHSPATAPY